MRASSEIGPSGPRASKFGQTVRQNALGLVPIAVLLLSGVLMYRWPVAPSDLPLPNIDTRLIAAAEATDDGLVGAASPDARAIGSLLREFRLLQHRREELVAHPKDEGLSNAITQDLVDVRGRINRALEPLVQDVAVAELRRLRATQLHGFLREVERYKATGQESEELAALAGAFVPQMKEFRWIRDGHHVEMDASVLRVMFKLDWNEVAGLGEHRALQLTPPEKLLLYRFQILHPYVRDRKTRQLIAKLQATKTPADTKKANELERAPMNAFVLERVARVGDVDPSYPTALAKGIALSRTGRADLASEQFNLWIEKHPEGTWSLRAHNHLAHLLRTAAGP